MPKKSATTALTLPQVDKNLLDGAVDFINRSARTSSLQLAKTISEYVVDTFFAGDPARLRAEKHGSRFIALI